MKAIVPAAKTPPKRRLPAVPVLNSVADVDCALHEMAFLDVVAARANATAQLQIGFAKERCAAALVVDVDGTPTPLADRKMALENATLKFCDAHCTAVLEGVKGKTRRLTHGEIKWKKSPAKLGFIEGSEADDVVACCDEAAPHEAGLAAAVLRYLQRIKITERLTAAMLCKVEVKLDRTAVWKAYQAGAINLEDLEAVLLLVEPAEEFVSLKTYDYETDPASACPP
jgi:phage host-nuclease inhibitor protein Gam